MPFIKNNYSIQHCANQRINYEQSFFFLSYVYVCVVLSYFIQIFLLFHRFCLCSVNFLCLLLDCQRHYFIETIVNKFPLKMKLKLNSKQTERQKSQAMARIKKKERKIVCGYKNDYSFISWFWLKAKFNFHHLPAFSCVYLTDARGRKLGIFRKKNLDSFGCFIHWNFVRRL